MAKKNRKRSPSEKSRRRAGKRSADPGKQRSKRLLTWAEKNGPPVSGPTRRGRGTDLIERMIGYQLHGKARLEFEADGVRCRITVPLGHGPGAQ